MIIDTDDYAASGIEVLRFAGGEFHAKVGEHRHLSHVHIFAKIRSWDDFGMFLVVADAFRRQNIKVFCFMPYLPGARQDRATHGTALTSAIYASAIADVVSHVTFVDCHSLAAEEIYSDLNHTSGLSLSFIKDLIDFRPDMILAPDKGAINRVREFSNHIDQSIPLYFCDKKRDYETGRITSIEIPDIPQGEPRVEHMLIIDDICDGGGTFLALGDKIQRKYPNIKLHLYVTHGIFSQGFDTLGKMFQTIYTTNSWNNKEFTKMKVLDLLPYYLKGLTP